MSTAGSSHRAPALPPSGERLVEAPVSSDGVQPAPDSSDAAAMGANPDDCTVISQRPPITPTGSGRPTPPVELGKLLAGERLNHFELREYVGGGGMGAVFRALDTMLNREVALKVLSRDQGADEETRRRFQNEAQSAARLDHENIARVFYVGEDKGLNYIVFEFIEGINLREFVEKKGPLPLAETISYTLQVADALAHASSRDVVHRDIKPSNVIITQDGRAKLVDMGLARLHQVQSEGEDLTASGVTLGTFDYISPEQARDPRSADVRSDIYSLGCTVYFMLTGRPPFPEGTVLQKLLQHNSDAPPDPRELNPDLPEELSLVIRKMLAKDPRRRYQHPSELIEELCLLAEQIGCPTPGPSRLATWIPPREPARISLLQKHLPWMIPVAALLALVAILDRWQLDDAALSETQRSAAEELGVSQGPAPGLLAARGKANRESATDDDENRLEVSPAANRSEERPGAALEDAPGRASPDDAAANSDGRRPSRSAAANDVPVDSPAASTAEGSLVSSPSSPATRTANEETQNSNSASPAIAGDSRLASAESASSETTKLASQNRTPEGPATAKPPAALEALPPGRLVVGDEQGPQRFATLSAACAAAKSGDIIELRYSGRRQEIPISLTNLHVKILAKEPYQPVVTFAPNVADPYTSPHSMLRIVGGSLRLQNVGFELRMPRGDPSENWTLFEAQTVESLDLTKCTLTLKNASDQGAAYHDKVSFFHVKATPGAEAMMPKGMASIPPLEIHLQDCLVRGEATFLRNDDALPLRLQWRNGLLACSEWLLNASGATTMQSASGGDGGKIHLSFEHLTLVLGSGLCRMSNSLSAPALLDFDIQCIDSVVLGGADRAALIEQACIDSPGDSQRRLYWKGDRNIYGGLAAFWRIVDPNTALSQLEMSFKEWQSYWGDQREVQSSIAPLAWKRRPAAGQPFHDRTAADYAIDDAAEGAYPYDTSDDELVGVNASALPATAGERSSAETPSSPAPLANEALKLD